jgi:hypothetical protein
VTHSAILPAEGNSMIRRSTQCFRNSKKRRDPLCSSGEVLSFASAARTTDTWGKITSRRMPPNGVLQQWAREMRCSIATVKKLWEQGVL